MQCLGDGHRPEPAPAQPVNSLGPVNQMQIDQPGVNYAVRSQDLADSDAGLAFDLRMKIYNKVKEGQTDKEIINYLTERYGDFILFKPKLKSMTFFLWFAPFIFLGIGLLVFSRKFR